MLSEIHSDQIIIVSKKYMLFFYFLFFIVVFGLRKKMINECILLKLLKLNYIKILT